MAPVGDRSRKTSSRGPGPAPASRASAPDQPSLTDRPAHRSLTLLILASLLLAGWIAFLLVLALTAR